MKSKQFFLWAAIAAALGVAGVLVVNQRRQEYNQSSADLGGKVLKEFDLNAVRGLRIIQGSNTLNVVRSGDDWVVQNRGGYPANFADVAELVRKLSDLKVALPVGKIGPSRLGLLELTPETATTVELLDGQSKPLNSLLIGKKHVKGGAAAAEESPFGGGGGGFPDGRYVQAGGAVALVADPLTSVAPKPEDWLAKEFIKVEQPIYIEVKHEEGTNSFALSRTNELSDWRLEPAVPGEELDKNKLFSFNTLLSNPSFNDVIVSPDPAALGLDKATQAEVRTAAGFTYKFKIGKADGEDYAVQVAVDASVVRERPPVKDEKADDKTRLDKEFKDKLAKLDEKLKTEQAFNKWTYKVSKWTIDALLKNRSELLVEKKAAAAVGKKPDATPGLPALPGDPN